MSFLAALQRHMDTLGKLQNLENEVQQLADKAEATIRNGGKVIFMGNGGSAADSQHLAA